MIFTHGKTLQRQRAGPQRDPYSGTITLSDWTAPDEVDIPGAFIAQSSTATVGTATRNQAIESKSLYCTPGTDVQIGDRVRDEDIVYLVDGIPSADMNPFTGWQPICEIPLRRDVG